MQDEVNEKTIALYIKTGKLTAQTLQKAMKAILSKGKKQLAKPPQGKQSFHHQSDDGKYLIMGNGTRAFAVAAEQAQRDNPLKTAEQTIEQNGNMIDGIINNTPTVDELEAKVKAGEQISLVDLANAVKADKERGKGAKPEKALYPGAA